MKRTTQSRLEHIDLAAINTYVTWVLNSIADTVEGDEPHDVVIQSRDLMLIKEMVLRLTEANNQLEKENDELRETNRQLTLELAEYEKSRESVRRRELMWNEKLNTFMQTENSLRETIADMEHQKDEMGNEVADMHRKYQDMERTVQEMNEREMMRATEFESKHELINAKLASAYTEPSLTASLIPIQECKNCSIQFEEYTHEQAKAIAALENRLFTRDTSSTLFELETEDTKIMKGKIDCLKAKIDVLTSALKTMHDREAVMQATICECCKEFDTRETRNKLVSVLLSIFSLLWYLYLESMRE